MFLASFNILVSFVLSINIILFYLILTLLLRLCRVGILYALHIHNKCYYYYYFITIIIKFFINRLCTYVKHLYLSHIQQQSHGWTISSDYATANISKQSFQNVTNYCKTGATTRSKVISKLATTAMSYDLYVTKLYHNQCSIIALKPL